MAEMGSRNFPGGRCFFDTPRMRPARYRYKSEAKENAISPIIGENQVPLAAPCARSMLFCLTSRDEAQGLQPRPFALPRACAVCLFPATEGPDVWVPWARTLLKDGTEYVVTSQQQAAVAAPPSRLEPRSRDGMCCSGKTP